MSLGELLVIMTVALLVFGPNKLPMVAQHLARFMKHLLYYKTLLSNFWQQQLLEHQLQENQKKATQADTHYQENQQK